MELTRFQLTQWFRKGWYDEKSGSSSIVPPEADAAYTKGVEEYQRCGGECLYFDEEILKIILP